MIDTHLGLETLAWSLSKYPEPCYVELPRTPTAEEIQLIQDMCSEAISRGAQVRVHMKLAGQDGVELGAKVPDNYRDEEGADARAPVMRTVEIVGIDKNP